MSRRSSRDRDSRPWPPWRRLLPTLTGAVIAAAYVVIAPRSQDLAAHLLRTKLFATEGFGLWDNWWYGGHNVLGYSVLFPPLAALVTPQLVAAISVPISAALFESLVHRRFGEDAWLGALWFGIAAGTNLFTGRLTFALGVVFATGVALALQRDRPGIAAGLAVLTALASPVGALFAALAGAAHAIGAYLSERCVRPALPGVGVIVAALAPVLALAIAFPEGGSEPFAFSSLWPIVLISLLAIPAIPRRDVALRAGATLYALGCLAAYALPTPVGSNAARLGPLIAGPLVALIWWRRRMIALLAASLPLLYIQWQAPVHDVRTADDNRAATFAYFQPMMSYLSRQPGQPFRIEIPFTLAHFEAYAVAPEFPLARGWERQLDTEYDAPFYNHTLTAARYDKWLHQLAVRYVAVPDAPLDPSSKQEVALIDSGLPFLRLVDRTLHWRIYAVHDPTQLAQGSATFAGLGPNWVELNARHAGTTLIRVRWSPYWAVTQGSGCVAPYGDFIRLTTRRPGPVRIAMSFALTRIAATSRRCSAQQPDLAAR